MLQGRFSANATGVQSPGTTANLAGGARIKALERFHIRIFS